MEPIRAIIPTYERPQFLRVCVESLLEQSRPLAEIIIVDDGSSTDLRPALQDLAGPVRLIRQENRGKAAALNRGLAEIDGGYVWICDDDDIALPDAAERLGAALDGGGAGFAYGSYLRFEEDAATHRRKVFGPGYWPTPDETQDLFAALLDDFFVFEFASLIRRDAFQAVGPFREDLVRSQDYEMSLRLARRFEARSVPGPVFLQRQHDLPRGSQRDRFAPQDTWSKWVDYDQRIFEALHRELPLEAYAPRALADAAPAVQTRAAYLKRGCALARRKLWTLALEDLAQAGRLGGADRPTQAETAIAGRILAGKYGCAELIADRVLLGRLLRAFGPGGYGASLRRRAAKPLRWRARQALKGGRLAQAAGYMSAYARLLGRAPADGSRKGPVERPAPALHG